LKSSFWLHESWQSAPQQAAVTLVKRKGIWIVSGFRGFQSMNERSKNSSEADRRLFPHFTG
jgi:hypothetical protein